MRKRNGTETKGKNIVNFMTENCVRKKKKQKKKTSTGRNLHFRNSKSFPLVCKEVAVRRRRRRSANLHGFRDFHFYCGALFSLVRGGEIAFAHKHAVTY